jgi:PAS domain S-box-containing protein
MVDRPKRIDKTNVGLQIPMPQSLLLEPMDLLGLEISEPPPTPNLLIVEDTRSLLRLYTHVLAQAGYSVIQATSGEEAKKIILETMPDIVLLDRVLPDLDGSVLSDWIKGTPELSQTYVIMLSALKTSEDDRVSGLEAGADDYIVKPVSKRELLARVKVAVRLKTAQLALQASEAKHRTLAENSPDLILRVNRAGYPTYVNPRVGELFGLAAKDVVGKNAYELGIPDEIADLWFATCREVVETASERRIEFALPTQGIIRFIDARLVPEFDIYGEVNSILAVLRDFTEHVRTEQRLARLAAAVEQSTDSMVMTDPSGMIQYANAAFQQLVGTSHIAPGQTFFDLFGNHRGISEHFRQLLLDRSAWTGISFINRLDGVTRDVEGSIFPIIEASGEVNSIVAILRDVTERRRMEREREVILAIASSLRKATARDEIIDIVLNEIKSLLNVAGAAITTVDPVTGGTYIERAVGEHAYLTGRHIGEDQDLTAEILTQGESFIYNELTKPFPPKFSALQGANRAFLGVPMVLPQRSIGVIWIASENVISSHLVRLLEAIADMAANALHRVALFEELEQYATELEERVASRTRELAEANQQLRELDRLKSKFVSNVSHELRTPISNLKLYMSLLQRGKQEKRAHYEAMLQASVERLGQLVEDILSLSRVEISHYQPRELELTDLNAVINHIVSVYQPQAEAAGLQLAFHAEADIPLIAGDYNQLSQLVTNIIVNSLRYTQQGTINITTTCPNGRERIFLEVEDTGIGILPEDLPHVFDRFYRGNHRQPTEIPGTGLGLAIVKEIVEIHQGDISMESQVDVGTHVTVSLPVKQVDNGSKHPLA